MKFHPYSEIFPPLSDPELDALAADIKANGLREAIWLYDGQILDGRNRFLACQRAKVRPATRKYTGSDPLGFVVSLNIARRHLTESQRAMAAARIATARQGGDRRSEQAVNLPLETQATAAQKLHVSERSVRSARKVIAHGSHSLQRAVESGEVSVSRAASVAALPKAEQLPAAKLPPVAADDWQPDADEEAYTQRLEQEMAASLDKILAADDKLAASYAEITRQAAEITQLKLSRDGYLNGKGEVTRLLKSEQSKTERLQRRINELMAQNEQLRERIALMEESA